MTVPAKDENKPATDTPSAEKKPEEKPSAEPKQETATPAENKGGDNSEVDALKKKLAELEAEKAKDKSDLEKYREDEKKQKEAEMSAQQLLEQRDAELKAEKRKNTVQQKAAEKGLDPKLWDRVRGDTEEEIANDIDALMELTAKKPDGEETPEGKPDAAKAKGGSTQPGKQTNSDGTSNPVVRNKTAQSIMDWRSQQLKKG